MRTKEEQEAINKACKYHPETKEELNKLVDDPEVNLGEIDTTKITDMSELFKDSKRTDFSGIETWDTSNVTDMSGMFYRCEKFNQNISAWDVSSVKNMRSMFYACENFNQPIGDWDVGKVTNMNFMFFRCKEFNQDICAWNISNVENMGSMFESCKNFNQAIGNWNVEKVKNMRAMFYACENFKQDLNAWCVREVCYCDKAFYSAGLSYENVKDAFTKEQLLDSHSEKIIDALNNEKKQVKVQEQKLTKGRGR